MYCDTLITLFDLSSKHLSGQQWQVMAASQSWYERFSPSTCFVENVEIKDLCTTTISHVRCGTQYEDITVFFWLVNGDPQFILQWQIYANVNSPNISWATSPAKNITKKIKPGFGQLLPFSCLVTRMAYQHTN